jgi:hypothetical protein
VSTARVCQSRTSRPPTSSVACVTPWSPPHDLNGKKDMTTLDDLLATWCRWKSGFTGRRLDAPCSVEHEYQGKLGAPVNVRIRPIRMRTGREARL